MDLCYAVKFQVYECSDHLFTVRVAPRGMTEDRIASIRSYANALFQRK